MRIFHWIDRKLSVVESFFLIVFLCTMIGLAFLQVVLRNFFNSGIVWADVFLRHLVLWVLFFGAAQAARKDKHLNIDVLSKLFKDVQKRYISLIINGFSLFIVILLTRGAWDYLVSQYKVDAVLLLGIQRWEFQVIIPVGLVLIGYRFLLHFLEALRGILRGEQS